jgi:hypothetical protein
MTGRGVPAELSIGAHGGGVAVPPLTGTETYDGPPADDAYAVDQIRSASGHGSIRLVPVLAEHGLR